MRFALGLLLGLCLAQAHAGGYTPRCRVYCHPGDVANVTALQGLGDGRQRSLCRVTLALLDAHK